MAKLPMHGQSMPEKITLGKIEATPEALFIDTAYYLIGDVNKWNSEALIKFGHSGKDVYEDPVFSMIVEMPKDECYWKIIPQSNDRKPASRKNPCQRMGENHLEHAGIYL